jgi:amino acid permease
MVARPTRLRAVAVIQEGMMSYQKNNKSVVGSIIAVALVAALAIWQFYLFVNFETGVTQGSGTHHLWWAIALALIAFGAAFLVFSVFVRHDDDDDLHITSSPRATRT